VENRNLGLIILIGFLLRIISLPFAQVVDADATSRIFAAENWLANPQLIYEGIWPPLHFYFNAIAIFIFREHVYGPILFHILITCLTAIPVYRFTKREFSEKGAWFSALFYLLCPIVFRNSFHTLSELPHVFFIAMALDNMSLSIRKNNYKNAIYAGLFMTIAAGFRYEAWLLIAVFTGIFLWFKNWKSAFLFGSASVIFPAFWMIGNYMAHQDIFYGLSGAYHWNIKMEGVNDHISSVEQVKRLIYFPLSWFYFYSPILVVLLFWKLFSKIRKKEFLKSRFIWSVPFLLLFGIVIYKAHEGTLLLQHRFTSLLILLSAPFLSIIFEKPDSFFAKKWIAILILVTLLPFSYFWMKVPIEKIFAFSYTLKTSFFETRNSSFDAMAIPRLSNRNFAKYSQEINKELSQNSGLILDFVSWDNTFYLALKSQLQPGQIFIVDGSKHGEVYKEPLAEILKKYPSGIILIKCGSRFANVYEQNGDLLTFHLDKTYYVKLIPLTGETGIKILKYKITDHPIPVPCIDCSSCPAPNSLDFFIMKIKEDEAWMNDIKRKAAENNTSVEIQLIKDAKWMVDNTPK
jgi:4-amino-4-deoxy-L-arabinose transferase-like glycosyltransferase